jgi:hypothetical protein
MRWLEFPSPLIEVCGLPWFEETSPGLQLFPPRLKCLLPPEVYRLGYQTAGVRLRLATDSTSLKVQARYGVPLPSDNLTQFNKRGQALYADGLCWSVQMPDPGVELVELTFFQEAPKKMRQLCLYLPLYGEVEILSVGIDRDAKVEAPEPFALSRPVVFYGTSITQGGCASRPGLSYQAMVSRELNLDYVNMGFSGRGKCELELAQIIFTVDASCYVLDVGPNNPPAELEERFGPFLEELTHSRPEPVLVMLPTLYNHEFWSEEIHRENQQRRRIISGIASEYRKRGRKVELLERQDCMDQAFADCTVDGAHPNDLGFVQIAKELVPVLQTVLKL